jgi:hypothetical protein
MIRVRRNVFLPVFTGGLLLFLSAAPASYSAETGGAGLAVTKEVPHSKESIPEIKDRERTNPPPPRGDTAIPSHKVPRAWKDNNCGRTE